MEKFKNIFKEKNFVVAAGFVLLAYVFSRALLLSFTRDESFTFMEFVKPGYWLPDVYNSMSANDHLLNTWLMIMCNKFFGSSELSLRLPNVIAFTIYLFFSARFTREIENGALRFCSFLLLTLNPYLLDFFSAARGYGISAAMTMGSLYHLYLFLHPGRKFRHAIFTLLFASFAVLANFTLLNYFIFISAVFFVLTIKKYFQIPAGIERQKIVRNILVVLVFPLALFLLIAPILLRLRSAGSFAVQNFGVSTGLWADTFKTLFNGLLYDKVQMPFAVEILGSLILLIFISGLYISFHGILRKDRRPGILFLQILLGALIFFILLIYLLHIFAGVQFPKYRTGIFFLPFISLLAVFVLIFLNAKVKIISSVLISSLLVIHAFRSVNFHYFLEYNIDADVKTAVIKIKNDMDKSRKDSVSVGAYYKFHDIFNYYRLRFEINKMKPVERDGLLLEPHDYYFIFPDDIFGLQKITAFEMYSFPGTGTILIKNPPGKKNMKVLVSKYNDMESQTTSSPDKRIVYAGGFSCKTDSNFRFTPNVSIVITEPIISLRNVIFRLESKVYCERVDADIHFVICIEREGKQYSWKDAQFNYDIPSGKWQIESFTQIMQKEIKTGDVVKGYLWNTGNSAVYVDDLILKAVEYPF